MHAKVVVAAHPKSDYSDNPFENRKIFKYKTIELVKNCKFVIAQSSTSISFAVLYNKPLLFIYDNQLKEVHKTNLYPSLCSYAECLGCTPLNISDLDQAFEIKLPEINKKKYTKYKYDFLTNKSTENILSKEIILEQIISL